MRAPHPPYTRRAMQRLGRGPVGTHPVRCCECSAEFVDVTAAPGRNVTCPKCGTEILVAAAELGVRLERHRVRHRGTPLAAGAGDAAPPNPRAGLRLPSFLLLGAATGVLVAIVLSASYVLTFEDAYVGARSLWLEVRDFLDVFSPERK